MGAPTYTLPTNNSDTATEEPKITLALAELKSLLTANLGDANVSPGSLTDTSLASPNTPAYRVVHESIGTFASDLVAGTYMPLASGVWNVTSAGTTQAGPRVFPWVAADYAVAGKTTKLRLRATVVANATAPGMNFTFGLYPATVAGAADLVAVTMGTVVTSSTRAINTPSASTITTAVNSDFTVPADGAYILGVVSSGTLANNSSCVLSAQLQVRNV